MTCSLLTSTDREEENDSKDKVQHILFIHVLLHLKKTISVLQACCAVTTEYGIPSDFVRKPTASLKIKISTAQVTS